MQYELVAILCVIFCLFILGAEYFWLALLAKRQEDSKNKYKAASQKVESMVEGILYSPTKSSRENEIQALKELMGGDEHVFEIINAQLCFWDEYGGDETLGNRSEVIDTVYTALDPVKLFSDILKKGKKYNVGYACRRLADFDAYDYLLDITDLSKSKNRNISYNAAMALARLGYTEGVADYILKIQNDKKYSFRIVGEIFDSFSGDRAELASAVFDKCNGYMRTTVIKAISQYGIARFEPVFREGAVSKDKNMRAACVKALGDLANPANEHDLLVASKDRDWIVRLSAVKGLQKIATPAALESIKEAIKDKEWWVRQAAAGALIQMNVNISDIEEILSGYDKYASDAIKYALYCSVNMSEK